MLKDFAALSTGLVSLQEKGMKLSKSVDLYSDEEYPSMKASLAGVSENIASLQDFLGARVKVLEYIVNIQSNPLYGHPLNTNTAIRMN